MANQNQHRQNNNYRGNYEKKVTNFVKTFTKFEDGYAELISIVPEIKSYGGSDPMFDAVIYSIMNTIRENTPSLSNSNYPNTLSFSIDAREVGLRTDGNLAFGWNASFDRDTGSIRYRFRVTFINMPTYRKTMATALQDVGWTMNESMSQSRFWNKIEGKGRDNRANGNKKFSSNPDDRIGRKVAEADPPEDTTINPDIADQLKDYVSPDSVEGPKEVAEEKHEAEPDPNAASVNESPAQ